MRVLLDTCVLSEIQRPGGDGGVRQFVEDLPEGDLFISVLTVGELAKGISLLEAGRRKRELAGWLQSLEAGYAERILAVDVDTSRIWGEVAAKAQQQGQTTSVTDGLIAATAIRHGLYVVTRNVQDFEPTGAMMINPWSPS